MSKKTRHSKNLLVIDVEVENDSVTVLFSGKSLDRDPSDFITPILTEAMQTVQKNNGNLILDFQALDFMSSSTITPVSKFIELGKASSVTINIVYQKSKKWQDLNFSALRIFETEDKKITITGK